MFHPLTGWWEDFDIKLLKCVRIEMFFSERTAENL